MYTNRKWIVNIYPYILHVKFIDIQMHSFIIRLPSNRFHLNTSLGISSARRRLSMAHRENEFDIVASKL